MAQNALDGEYNLSFKKESLHRVVNEVSLVIV